MRLRCAFGFGALLILAACRTTPGGGTASGAASEGAPVSAPAQGASTPPAGPATVAAPPGEVPSAIAGANLSMDSLEVDGLTVKQLSCKSSGGIFASAGIVGALAKERERLSGCSAAPTDVRVHFAFDGGKTSDVRVAGADAKVQTCVATALAAVAPPKSGACTLTLTLGPR